MLWLGSSHVPSLCSATRFLWNRMVERCLHSSTFKAIPSRKFTIRTLAFALCLSIAEHACSTKKSATGCSKQTHVSAEKRYVGAGMCDWNGWKVFSLLVTYHVFQLVVQCSYSPGCCTTLSCTSSWLQWQPPRLLVEAPRGQKDLPVLPAPLPLARFQPMASATVTLCTPFSKCMI